MQELFKRMVYSGEIDPAEIHACHDVAKDCVNDVDTEQVLRTAREEAVRAGIEKYGTSNWSKILRDNAHLFAGKKPPYLQVCDCARMCICISVCLCACIGVSVQT
jgi:hypothetical protein